MHKSECNEIAAFGIQTTNKVPMYYLHGSPYVHFVPDC